MHILINGAGIAGLTLAYWLHEFGFSVSVVDKRPDFQDAGYMIDFYGPGFDVAEKMGMLDQLRTKHYPIKEISFVNRNGKIRSSINIEKLRKSLHFRHFNFMRGDLAIVLFEMVKQTVPIRFDTSVSQIQQGSDTLHVAFTDKTNKDYDLVIGADGIHSKIRKLVWGDEKQFEHFLGYYVACSIVEDRFDVQKSFYSHIEPGTHAAVYPIRNHQAATFFAFKSEQLNIDDRQQQLNKLREVFGTKGWRDSQLIDATEQSPYLYFDSVSQVKLPTWHKGRVALVGDACQCLTLLAGQGASMAMAGAYILATELSQANGDYQIAFPLYQEQLKPEIDRRQMQAKKLASSFVPDNKFSIWMTNLFSKVAFFPGFRSLFQRQIGATSVIKGL